MYRQITMRRLVAIFMIAGLVLAPLSRPVMGETAPDGAMADMSHDMSATTDGMADDTANDMPCCPPKAPAPIGCEKCLLMAACMTTGFTVVPVSALLQFPAISSRTTRPKNDSWLQGVAHPPPDHPPRILI